MKGKLWANRFILAGVALAVLYWLIEGTLDVFLYREEGGILHLILPLSDLGELIWDRMLTSTLFVVFGVAAQVAFNKQSRAEEAMRRHERRFRSLVENASDMITILETDGTVRYVSPAGERVTGYRSEEWVGANAFGSLHPDDVEQASSMFAEIVKKPGLHPPVECRVPHKDGSWRYLEHTVNNLLQDPTVNGIVINSQDITERKEAEERLHHQAYYDLLTDLPNRQLFMDRLKQALRRTKRQSGHKKKVAVLFMDLDGFKHVNDSLGHEVGDRLLVSVGERLRGCLRPEDTLARFGGDEFTVLVENVEDPAAAVRVVERILEAHREPFVLEGRELFVKPSIGITLGEARTTSAEYLLRDADTAMYQAKGEGLGYVVFEPVMYEQALRRLKMENDLRRAVEAEEFAVHYQPIIDLRSGEEVWGVEALVRWQHPERGLLDPKEFVPAAEESGLVVPMGERVLKVACEQAMNWQERYPHVPPLVMAVNLSARQLGHPDIAKTVEGMLRETGLEARCLSLDITETVYVQALEGNTAALNELKRLGVRISIDDFGTGYSSLSYLKRLPADALKIDRSFIRGLGEDLEDTALVQMIIDLAHTLGMEVVAEGVESADQAEQLIEMGCDFGQGYHFAQPLPREAVPKFLAR